MWGFKRLQLLYRDDNYLVMIERLCKFALYVRQGNSTLGTNIFVIK